MLFIASFIVLFFWCLFGGIATLETENDGDKQEEYRVVKAVNHIQTLIFHMMFLEHPSKTNFYQLMTVCIIQASN